MVPHLHRPSGNHIQSFVKTGFTTGEGGGACPFSLCRPVQQTFQLDEINLPPVAGLCRSPSGRVDLGTHTFCLPTERYH